MTTYTSRQMPLTRYSTTKRPTVLVGPSPAQLLKVKSETAPEMTNMPTEERRISQTDVVVPSSYSWKPTNPLIRRHAHSAEVKPFCAAVKYGKAPEPGGMTPESRMSDVIVSIM